jgi:hypothetical protein
VKTTDFFLLCAIYEPDIVSEVVDTPLKIAFFIHYLLEFSLQLAMAC